MIPKLPNIWQTIRNPFKATRYLATNQPDTYYSSQSGRVMRVPGSAGTRIHETSAFDWHSVPSRMEMLRKLCLASVDTLELWPDAATELKAVQGWSEFTTKFTSRVSNEEDLQYVKKNQDIISYVDVFVSCDSHLSGLQLVKDARGNELQVRAYVCNAFQLQDGTGTDPAVVQDTVVALADLDACSIIIADDNQKADEDSLR